MLVGEFLGAEVGDLFYTAFLKGGEESPGLEAAKEQLKQKWESFCLVEKHHCFRVQMVLTGYMIHCLKYCINPFPVYLG